MAKIKFGMMMTDARGKLGGQVFSKNRSGAYVRTKVTPVNPRTTFQQSNRALLGNVSTGWAGLTRDQIRAWNEATSQWVKTNVFGDSTKPSGKNLYTGLNKVLSVAYPALPLLTLPPAKVEFPNFVIGSADYIVATQTLSISVQNAEVGGFDFQVRATPPVGNGISYFNNLLRNLGQAVPVVEGGFLNIVGGYANRFGALVVGQRFYVEVRMVAENGQLSVPFTLSVRAI